LKISGGAHVMSSSKLLNKSIHKADPEKMKKEAEIFKAMCFLLRANETRYEDFLKKSKKGVYKG